MNLIKTPGQEKYFRGTLTRTVLCFGGSLAFAACMSGQQTVGSFAYNSHTVAIDRMPGARFLLIESPSQSNSRKILEADFSGFDPNSSLDTVHFEILFVQDQANRELTVGKLRLLLTYEAEAANNGLS